MTPGQAIQAGELVRRRNFLRALFRTNAVVTIAGAPDAKGAKALTLGKREAQAALNAIDEVMSARLSKLGVSEYEDGIPRPDADVRESD